jgi:hypothetical protein
MGFIMIAFSTLGIFGEDSNNIDKAPAILGPRFRQIEDTNLYLLI